MNCAANHCRARCGKSRKHQWFIFYFTGSCTYFFIERAPTSYLINGIGKDVQATFRAFADTSLTGERKQCSTWTIMSLDGACRLCHAAQGDWKITQIDRPFCSRKFLNYMTFPKILARAKWSSRRNSLENIKKCFPCVKLVSKRGWFCTPKSIKSTKSLLPNMFLKRTNFTPTLVLLDFYSEPFNTLQAQTYGKKMEW